MSGATVVGALGTVTIPSVGATDPTTIGDTDAGAATLLPDPVTQLAMTGDPGAMVAALVVESSKDERDVARQVQRTQDQIQDREDQAQVQAMRDKATAMRTQALVSGAIGVAQGALAVGGAAATAESSRARELEALSKLVGTGRDVGDKVGAAANEDADANIAQHEHNAAQAKSASSEAYDDVRDAKKLLDGALDFYREYSDASDQAKAAATHRG